MQQQKDDPDKRKGAENAERRRGKAAENHQEVIAGGCPKPSVSSAFFASLRLFAFFTFGSVPAAASTFHFLEGLRLMDLDFGPAGLDLPGKPAARRLVAVPQQDDAG